MGGIDPDELRKDLVNAAQVAERLGVKHPETVHKWRERYADFPQPVFAQGHVRIWSWTEVRGWAKATGRLPEDGSQ